MDIYNNIIWFTLYGRETELTETVFSRSFNQKLSWKVSQKLDLERLEFLAERGYGSFKKSGGWKLAFKIKDKIPGWKDPQAGQARNKAIIEN